MLTVAYTGGMGSKFFKVFWIWTFCILTKQEPPRSNEEPTKERNLRCSFQAFSCVIREFSSVYYETTKNKSKCKEDKNALTDIWLPLRIIYLNNFMLWRINESAKKKNLPSSTFACVFVPYTWTSSWDEEQTKKQWRWKICW